MDRIVESIGPLIPEWNESGRINTTFDYLLLEY